MTKTLKAKYTLSIGGNVADEGEKDDTLFDSFEEAERDMEKVRGG